MEMQTLVSKESIMEKKWNKKVKLKKRKRKVTIFF